MKGKRFLTMLLAALMVIGLLPPAAVQAEVVTGSPAYAAVAELPAGADKIVTSIDAFAVNNGAVSMTLSVQSSYKGVSSENMEARAVIVSADDYVSTASGKFSNKPLGVTVTNWDQKNAVLNQTFWRYGNGKISAQKVTISNFKNNENPVATSLRKRPIAVDNAGSQQVTDHDCYYDDYVCILHISEVGTGKDENYVVFKFQVDSQGNLKRDSYMVRYVKNTASMGTTAAVSGTMAPQITDLGTDTAVSANQYGRVGYTFMGWDNNAQFLQSKAAGKTGSELANAIGNLDDATAKAGMGYPSGGGTVPSQEKDSIYNLYAQWKPNAVKFDTAKADTVTATRGTEILSYMKDPIPVITLPSPQVNAAYSQTKIALAASPTDSRTNKSYGPYSGKPLQLSTGETVTTSNPGTYGLTIAADGQTAWKITGTPTVDSKGQDVYILLQVQDATNLTQDWIVIHFKEVKKGAQPIPTLDVNTGLQSRITTAEDSSQDGQIYGFYSNGPKKGADTGYQDAIGGTNTGLGTGTMTNYYLSKGMVFEYRPIKVDGQPVVWADGDAEKTTTEGYADMPNGGWREVPFPNGRYTPDNLTKIQTAGEKNAKTLMYSTLANGNAATKAVVTDKTNDPKVAASEAFKTDGWLDSYGWIEFNTTDAAGLPEIHGLQENDVYQVRFRANETYEVSDPQTITIGGAVAGGEPSGGSGVDVNLAGGQWKAGEESDGKTFEDAAAALTPGGTLTLPEIEPEREGGYTFAGWTLGLRDSDGRLILYRRGAAVTPPAEPEMVTVTWINGETNETISHTVTSVPKGSTVAEEDYPETPADIDKDAEGENPAVHKTFDQWTVAVDETTGNITITAVFKEKPAVSYVWTDPLREGEDKTVENAGWTNPSYNPPMAEQHPAAPDHGEDHPFKEWVMGEAVEVPVEGSETGETRLQVTVTATYKEKITYIWMDPEIRGEEGQEPPSQVVQTKELFDLTKDDYPATDPSYPGMDFKGWEVGEPVRGEDGTVTVTITATYGQKVTYVWVDPKKEGEDKTVQTAADQFEKPEDPEARVHEGWTFLGWTVGEPVTDEESGVTTVTITATYEMEKWTVLDTLPAIENFPASLAAVWNGGSGGGGGLAVNLAGGHWTDEDQGSGQSFTADCAALQPGDSITIPDLTPAKQYYEFAGWTMGEFQEDGTLITFQQGDKVTLGDKPSSLAAVWNATTEGFMALTLFDWDGEMIGTKVIAKVEDKTTQERLVTAAFEEIQTQYATVLTSHAGYDFGCWIPYSSTTPTAYGVRVQSGDTNLLAEDNPAASDITRQLNEPTDKVTPSDVTGDMQIKAAYVANPEALAVSDATARRYTVTPVNYDRYGTAGVVSITVRVTRLNESGQPVPRAASPALRVAMTANGVTTYSLYKLSGADEEDVEIVPFATPTGGVTQIVWSVIDTYGVVDWTGGAGSRLNSVTSTYTKGNTVTESLDNSNRQVLKKGERQYLYECYLGWINSLCEQQDPNDTSYSSLTVANAAQLRTIGISNRDADGKTVSAANIKKKIYEAWYAKNYTGGNRNDTLVDLTKREITDAIGSTANSIFSEGD